MSDTDNVQELLAKLETFERSVAGIREHLRQQGVHVEGPVANQPPPSTNPLVRAVRATRWQHADPLPPPTPPLPAPIVTPDPDPSFSLVSESPIEQPSWPIERWDEILIRPGMAQAMLFVIMPVIEQAIAATTPEEASAAIDQMDLWAKLTMAQRIALTDLFRWVEIEMTSTSPVIPPTIVANMAAAQANYEQS